MIYDKLANIGRYKGMHANLDKAIAYIYEKKYLINHVGKNEILGEELYFNCPDSPTTKVLSFGKLEAHKKYIDIHIVIEGKETIAYTDISKCENIEDYNEADDYYLMDGKFDTKFLMDNTNFYIVFPDEPHLAVLASDDEPMKIKKVIFKVLY